ncbi:MAG: ATP-binding protein [Candidatus Helarchaeota archaeon]
MEEKIIRILLIENNPTDVQFIEHLLNSSTNRFSITNLQKISEAIELLKNTTIDGVLISLNLSNSNVMDEFTKFVSIIKDTPIILIIGSDDTELVMDALSRGVQDYLIKGQFDADLLSRVIMNSIERKRIEAKLRWELTAKQVLSEICNALIDSKINIKNLAKTILKNAKELTDSEHGYISTIDPETKENICQSSTLLLSNLKFNKKKNKKNSILVSSDGKHPYIWEYSLKLGKSFYTNSPNTYEVIKNLPKGHIHLNNFLSVPVKFEDKIIGQLILVNSKKGYNDRDLEIVTQMVKLFALVVQNLRSNEQLKKYSEGLEELIEKRTKELKKTHNKLIRREKLATIGKLIGSIAHELRNPLGVISNSIYYLNLKLKDSEPKISKHLKILEKEVKKSNKIISDLLDFSRIKKPIFESRNINFLIKESLSNIKIPDEIELKLKLDSDIPRILLDSIGVQQIFQNLILNAIQAMPNGGSLNITSKIEGNKIILIFEDTGVGIPKENFKRIFEPLFSTKAKGIGLGLPIVKELIEMHNGNIEFESEVGVGTKFIVKLPIERGSGVDD